LRGAKTGVAGGDVGTNGEPDQARGTFNGASKEKKQQEKKGAKREKSAKKNRAWGQVRKWSNGNQTLEGH